MFLFIFLGQVWLLLNFTFKANARVLPINPTGSSTLQYDV